MLRDLASLNVELKVMIEVTGNPQSWCELIALFDERVQEIAMEHPFYFHPGIGVTIHQTCPNLTNLSILDKTGIRDIDTFLYSFLRNAYRAASLYKLVIQAVLSNKTLDVLFSNCSKLRILRLIGARGNRSLIRDEHFVNWASTGVQPERVLIKCFNCLTDTGMVPFLNRCGAHLVRLVVCRGNEPTISEVSIRSMLRNCKRLNDASVPASPQSILTAQALSQRSMLFQSKIQVV